MAARTTTRCASSEKLTEQLCIRFSGTEVAMLDERVRELASHLPEEFDGLRLRVLRANAIRAALRFWLAHTAPGSPTRRDALTRVG